MTGTLINVLINVCVVSVRRGTRKQTHAAIRLFVCFAVSGCSPVSVGECWGRGGGRWGDGGRDGMGKCVCVRVCLGLYVSVCAYFCGGVSSCLFVFVFVCLCSCSCLLVFVGLYICAVYFFVWSVCLIVCFCLCLFVFMYFSFVFF